MLAFIQRHDFDTALAFQLHLFCQLPANFGLIRENRLNAILPWIDRGFPNRTGIEMPPVSPSLALMAQNCAQLLFPCASDQRTANRTSSVGVFKCSFSLIAPR